MSTKIKDINAYKLPLDFYQNDNVVEVAKSLLGKKLITSINGFVAGGYITETEAYDASEKGCHAYNNKRTKRTEILFDYGGKAYVYLCYGIHYLFNVVTGKKDHGCAVLIRGIHPTIGIDIIEKRRNQNMNKNICDGPGKVAQALSINKSFYGIDLQEDTIWIEEGIQVRNKDILTTPRIGIDYAEKDALLPWRFLIKETISIR